MEYNFQGQLLIAMPNLRDPRFAKTVILICEFTKQIVMGLIINQKIDNFNYNSLINKIEKNTSDESLNKSIFNGGPVYQDRCFILSDINTQFTDNKIQGVFQDVSISTSIEIFQKIKIKSTQYKLFLGCSVWTYDQFLREIRENSWLHIPAEKDFIFLEYNQDDLWDKCMLKIGIKKNNLHTGFGNA